MTSKRVDSAGNPRPIGLLVGLEGDGELLSDALARAGYLVEHCSSSLEAIRRIERGEARLLMAPLRMAEITGMELAGLARCLSPSLTIVLVPLDQDRVSIEAVIRAGADALLSRPLRLEAVSSCLFQISRS